MTYIIGIDPGPMVGACLLRLPAMGEGAWFAETVQLPPSGLWAQIGAWVDEYPILAVAAERYVVRHRASRVNDPGASKAARDVLGGLAVCIKDTRLIERAAVEVKPWATDDRLKAAGLFDQTKGLRHARDAVRHALYSACRDFGARIPRTAVSA